MHQHMHQLSNGLEEIDVLLSATSKPLPFSTVKLIFSGYKIMEAHRILAVPDAINLFNDVWILGDSTLT